MSDIYRRMLEELGAGELNQLQNDVFDLLRRYPSGLTRAEFVQQLFGYTPTDLANDVNDRKVRKAIEALRGRLFPIVSSSGEAGYRLDTSRAAVAGMVREWMSRREKLTDLINKAVKFYEIPEYSEPVQVSQLEMAL